MNIKILMILFAMVFCLTANNCCVSSDANTISRELKSIQKEIPLPFHDDLVKIVNEYESNPLPQLFTNNERFIEKELQDRDMPLELKYLPVSLTKMQPDYQNRERCGVWALPTLVGLRYGLTINESLDERFAMEASTRVALDYLAELQQKYDDWWHSILAFASSPNALQRAMTHSDKTLEVWDFYDQKLIPESHVICDFIACVYAYHNHGDTTALVETEDEYARIRFSKPIATSLLAKETKLPVQQIKQLNPVFRSNVLIPSEKYPLILPKNSAKQFPAIEQELYRKTAAGDFDKQEKPVQPKIEQPKPDKNIRKHIVKKGETLGLIAKKHHVTVSQIQEWNHLESDFIRDGQELIIKK